MWQASIFLGGRRRSRCSGVVHLIVNSEQLIGLLIRLWDAVCLSVCFYIGVSALTIMRTRAQPVQVLTQRLHLSRDMNCAPSAMVIVSLCF